MRALRKTAAKAGADLVEVPVPEPVAGEVLIRVEAASVCGTDLHIYRWDPWAQGRVRSRISFSVTERGLKTALLEVSK